MIRDLERKTILVTGAGGFLGSAVVRAMAESAASLRALLGPPGFSGAIPCPNAVFAQAEIDDLSTITALAKGVDIVVHLAGPAGVGASFEMAPYYARVHVAGTATVLEACRRAGVARLVHISSAEVYGLPSADPVPEDHRLEARSPYAAAKIGAERFVESFALGYGLDAIVLRPFSIYGPSLSPQSLVGTVLRQVRSGGAIVIADPRPVRDYCYIDDFVHAVLLATSAPADRHHIFNIGSGVGSSVVDVVGAVLRLLGRNTTEIVVDPSRRRPGGADILRLVADTSRAKRDLGWAASMSLEEGLRHTIEWSEGQCPSESSLPGPRAS
jgi:nucleoside-diphosphate-sugar epimerase